MFSIVVKEKLELRLLLTQDAEVFFTSIQKNRKYLEIFMPRIRENKSISDTKSVIEMFINQLAQNNGFRCGIYYDNNFVGIIGLKYL